MHFLTFRFKRAHLRSVATAWPFAKQFRLTPARFDYLCVIRNQWGGETTQRDIRRALGLARITVSKMLRKLEGLGLITRRPASDRRTRAVELTAEGKRRIDAAVEFLETEDSLHRIFETAFGYMGDSAHIGMWTLHKKVRCVARWIGDRAWHNYGIDSTDP